MNIYDPDNLNRRWAKFYDYCNAMVSLYGRMSVEDAFGLIQGYEDGAFEYDDFLNFLYDYQWRRANHNDREARFLLYITEADKPKQKHAYIIHKCYEEELFNPSSDDDSYAILVTNQK